MDPYYHFNTVLSERMDVLGTTVSSYLSTVSTCDTSTSLDYKTLRKTTKKLLKSTEGTLKDLQSTIRAVENDRGKFEHIDDDELSRRRAFVSDGCQLWTIVTLTLTLVVLTALVFYLP
ncbi:hypothetical protein TrCOL_g13300 [Triparma columacea]|uniref:Syntaxin 6/10/61 N-terminal domain-containing protein n=1 Tax=Triparma columacea TaxID=722753 RepID=A0A9W7GAT9_9STRA|nr:hypothetical protein TrCOL_g13300 [Triparma columacea]